MQTIVEKLKALRAKDAQHKVFGANAHRYEMNAPLAEKAVRRVEVKYNFSLPEDYRWFLTHVGNGGAGPFYGVFPLGMNDDGHDLASWDKVGLIGPLDQAFPHTQAWNLSESFWGEEPSPGDDTTEDEEEAMWEAWDEKLMTHYWGPAIMQGAIPVCHEGCALRDWLVVTGPQAGTMWRDLRADNEGIAPLKNKDGTSMTFSDWYLDWLDSNLG